MLLRPTQDEYLFDPEGETLRPPEDSDRPAEFYSRAAEQNEPAPEFNASGGSSDSCDGNERNGYENGVSGSGRIIHGQGKCRGDGREAQESRISRVRDDQINVYVKNILFYSGMAEAS